MVMLPVCTTMHLKWQRLSEGARFTHAAMKDSRRFDHEPEGACSHLTVHSTLGSLHHVVFTGHIVTVFTQKHSKAGSFYWTRRPCSLSGQPCYYMLLSIFVAMTVTVVWYCPEIIRLVRTSTRHWH
jgi:hypothetical protein